MISASVIHSLINRPESLEGNKQSFRPGQVFQGKIMKLFPNQTAEVQVGSQRVIAQLEVPLSAGERYWFQVTQGEGKVHLKVLTDGKGSGPATHLEGFLKQFSIPETKLSIALIRFFLSEQLPITKETLSSSISLLQAHTPSEDDLQGIKQLISRELPLTKSTLEAVVSSLKNPTIHTLLSSLKSELEAQEMLSTVGTRLKETIEPLTQTGKEKLGKCVLQELVARWTQTKDPAVSNQAFKALQQMGVLPNKEEGILLQQAANKLTSLSEGKVSPNQSLQAKTAKEVSTAVTSGMKENLSGLMKNYIGAVLKENQLNNQSMKQLFLLLSSNMELAQFEEEVTRVLTKEGLGVNKGIQNDTNQLLQGLLTQIEEDPAGEFKSFLKSVIQALGLSHEAESIDSLKGNKIEEGTKLENMKSLLLSFLNEEMPSKLKDQAEAVLNRLTGIQLMSSESSPIQQIVMQFPFSFLNKQTDMTIQWNGKKDSNGKIDPSYCRVLFYLDLEYLNETVIDMQIQNRIMKIGIINNNDNIKLLSAPFLESLKENLRKLEYQLSSVSFQSQEERANLQTKKVTSNKPINQSYSGVDIKI